MMNVEDKYSNEEKIAIGKSICWILMLRKAGKNKDRYQTTWGDKTALGIFRTVVRFASMIEKGEGFNE